MSFCSITMLILAYPSGFNTAMKLESQHAELFAKP